LILKDVHDEIWRSGNSEIIGVEKIYGLSWEGALVDIWEDGALRWGNCVTGSWEVASQIRI